MEDQEIYEYQAIDAKDQIRVLHLEPGAFTEPLIGNLLVRKLGDDDENPPAYNCMSYAWGPQQDFTSFTCDGKSLRITLVVDEMLRYLRKPKKACHLWIDAICINQAHNAEKSQQVRLMGRIYASALKVHVWLGPAADEDARAVDDLFGPESLGGDDEEMLAESYCHAFPDSLSQAFLSLEHFVSRSWFKRRWVLQELYLGRAVLIHCGDRETRWRSLYMSLATLHGMYCEKQVDHGVHDRVTALRGNLLTICKMQTFKWKFESDFDTNSVGRSYQSILYLLDVCHKAVCLDERDRLYSLYSLTSTDGICDKEMEGPLQYCPVDYSVHFSHVYTSFAGGAMKVGLFRYIMDHTVRFGSLAIQNGSWPSWVPAWNLTGKIDPEFRFLTYQRPLQRRLETWTLHPLWVSTKENLWGENTIHPACVHRMRALQLHGCIHHIYHTQSSTIHLDPVSYLKTVAKNQHAVSNSMVVWTVASAMSWVPDMLFRPAFNYRSVCCTNSYGTVGWSKMGVLINLTQQFMGLQMDHKPEERFLIDMETFASEAMRILEGLEGFCYEVEGSTTFSIAFAHVEPGDFVFRTPEAASGKDAQTGGLSPSAFGLIIRPYHSQSDAGPATFRLVGTCIDYYPDVKDPEIVEIVLV